MNSSYRFSSCSADSYQRSRKLIANSFLIGDQGVDGVGETAERGVNLPRLTCEWSGSCAGQGGNKSLCGTGFAPVELSGDVKGYGQSNPLDRLLGRLYSDLRHVDFPEPGHGTGCAQYRPGILPENRMCPEDAINFRNASQNILMNFRLQRTFQHSLQPFQFLLERGSHHHRLTQPIISFPVVLLADLLVRPLLIVSLWAAFMAVR